MKKFNLTYSITTEESASHGDHAFHGFVTKNWTAPRRVNLPKNPARWGLRDALEVVEDLQGAGGLECVEADSSPWDESCPPRWITWTFNNAPEYDESLQVSLHIDKLTPATACRVARLLNCYH